MIKSVIKQTTKEIKDRIDPKTTGSIWKKIRNTAGIISGITGTLLIIPMPPTMLLILKVITGIGVAISGSAHLDKSNKSNKTNLKQ